MKYLLLIILKDKKLKTKKSILKKITNRIHFLENVIHEEKIKSSSLNPLEFKIFNKIKIDVLSFLIGFIIGIFIGILFSLP